MRINTNVASLNAQEASTNTNKLLSSSLEKLSSGLRINKAADDASGLAIADKLRTQASSLGQGISNANSASALIQIADKAMSEQSNILDTVKTKLIQASTSTTSADGREAIRKDVNKLLTQFDNIAAQTNYNGTSLLQKSATDTARQDELSFQLGEDKTFDVNVQLTKASNSENLGGGSDTIATGTNITVAGSQQIKTDAAVTIGDVNVDADGADTAGTLKLNIEASGIIGKMTASTATQIDASSQTQNIQDALVAIASVNADFTDNGNGSFSVTGSVSFGDLDFSALGISQTTVDENIKLNVGAVADTNISILNKNADTTTPNKGQLDIAGTGMTGGNLLNDIKNVAELTVDKANDFMQTIDEALTQMNANRSDFGSTQNQLESSIRNMQTTQTNLKAAESVIRDVDYAQESASFNKQNIIAQAGTYAMSQANAMAQNVQKLLQ